MWSLDAEQVWYLTYVLEKGGGRGSARLLAVDDVGGMVVEQLFLLQVPRQLKSWLLCVWSTCWSNRLHCLPTSFHAHTVSAPPCVKNNPTNKQRFFWNPVANEKPHVTIVGRADFPEKIVIRGKWVSKLSN